MSITSREDEEEDKRWLIIREVINRLSNQELWDEFKRHFNIHDIQEFGTDCFERLEAYTKALEGEIERAGITLESKSPRELIQLLAKIEDTNTKNERIRFGLRNQESRLRELSIELKGAIKGLGGEPQSIFYHPKPEKIQEDVVCPFCKKKNTNFLYGNDCRYCLRKIPNPWREHTICPKCDVVINRSDIFEDPSAYELDTKTNHITCPESECESRFNWKKYRRQPEKFGLKVCIYCDSPFNPNKHNWRKQRLCPECINKDVDTHKLDHPDYHQKRYREKKLKKK